MPSYKTSGLVLRRSNLGEADRIVTFMTPEYGKLRAVARGVRKISSRQAGHLELFGTVDLMLARGKSLDVITSVRLKAYPDRLSSDYRRLAYAYLFAEMLEKLVAEGQPAIAAYELASEVYGYLAGTGEAEELLELYFKLGLLAALGVEPEMRECAVCRRSEAPQYFFSATLGGIVDGTCSLGTVSPISEGEIKLWRLVQNHPYDTLSKVVGAKEAAKTSLKLCNRFYDHQFGTRFKSGQLLLR